MSKIKNGGLDQYGPEPFKQQQFGTAGVEMVNHFMKFLDTLHIATTFDLFAFTSVRFYQSFAKANIAGNRKIIELLYLILSNVSEIIVNTDKSGV